MVGSLSDVIDVIILVESNVNATALSNKMLLSCINSPEVDNPNDCNNSSVNIPVIEGFTSDMTTGPGVSYVPEGRCPDGQTKINGKCYQVCRGCNYNDVSGYFGDSSKYPFGINSSHDSACGKGLISNGIDNNGFIKCKKDTKGVNTIDDDFNVMPYVN